MKTQSQIRRKNMIIRWGYNNRLKVAGIRQLLSEKNRKYTKASGEKTDRFSPLALF
jgi:hypothetical protein